MQDKIDAITDPQCRTVIDELVTRIQIAQQKTVEILQAVPTDLDWETQKAILDPALIVIMGLYVEA